MALATSVDNRVLCRTILIASDGLDIYFFTWKGSRKYSHIERNPNVCICKDIVEVEGVVEVLGELSDDGIKNYTEIFHRKYPKEIDKWRLRLSMMMLRIRPRFAVVGALEDDEGSILEYLDFEETIVC